jgi:hypothetical protein
MNTPSIIKYQKFYCKKCGKYLPQRANQDLSKAKEIKYCSIQCSFQDSKRTFFLVGILLVIVSVIVYIIGNLPIFQDSSIMQESIMWEFQPTIFFGFVILLLMSAISIALGLYGYLSEQYDQ